MGPLCERSASDKRTDPGGEIEVECGETPATVGGEPQAHDVPADVGIRMVSGLLRGGRDPVDELHGLREITEPEAALETFALTGPAGRAPEGGADLRFVQTRGRRRRAGQIGR